MSHRKTKFALGVISTLSIVHSAMAGGVLRLDEAAVRELDPAKTSDYADSILMFNDYDTLVLPIQSRLHARRKVRFRSIQYVCVL